MRIKIVAGDLNHIQLWPMQKRSVLKYLASSGIKFVTRQPDVLLFHTYKASPALKKQVFESKLPILILERIASARVLSREEIQRDDVIGILKSTAYRDRTLDNSSYEIESEEYPEKRFKNNYHSRLIYESLDYSCSYHSPKNQIPNEYFDKIELWYNFGTYAMMKPYIKEEDVIDRHRPIDIGFIGTTQYGPRSHPITAHRKECMARCNALKNCKTDLKDHRIPGKKNYIDNILNCKIGISPWGLGEKCYRDFEVILGGGVLLKPDTSFVEDWIDTYKLENSIYVHCKPDFSDIQQKVDEIKRNWKKYKSFRKNARHQIIKHCWSDKYIAKHLIRVIESCFQRIK